MSKKYGILGEVIIGVVATVLANDTDLNLSGVLKTFVSLASWIPLAIKLQKMQG